MPTPLVAILTSPTDRTLERYRSAAAELGIGIAPLDAHRMRPTSDGGLAPWPPDAGWFHASASAVISPHRRAIARVLERRGVPMLNTLAAREQARDKWASACALARAGLPQPRCALVPETPGARDARARAAAWIGFPLVVKNPRGSLGREVRLVADAEALEAALPELDRGWGEGVLLQEFIAESAGCDLRVVLLDGRVLAASARATLDPGEFRAVGGRWSSTAAELSPEEARLAIEATATVGLDYGGVDLVRSARGPLVLEVNGEPGLIATERACGVDLAGAILRALVARG